MTENHKNIEEYEFKGSGLSTSEKRKGKERFERYRAKHHIDKESILFLLEELVHREIIQERYKKQLKRIEKTKNKSSTLKDENIVPKYVLNGMNDNLEQIINLQEKLGIFDNKEEKDFYKLIKQLEKKFELHRQENADEYVIPCPFCAKEFALKIRTTNYESFITPFFAEGKILANKPLFELYKQGKLTKEEVAKVLGTSADYVDFLEKYFSKQFPSKS